MMPQRAAIESCAGTGHVETPFRRIETLVDIMVVPTTTPRGCNVNMAAGTRGRLQWTANATRIKTKQVRQHLRQVVALHWRSNKYRY